MTAKTAMLPYAVLSVLCALTVQRSHAEVVIENSRVRAVIGDDAVWRSIVDKRTGKDWCYTDRKTYLADARINGKTDRAAKLDWDGRLLRVKFAKNDTELVYAVEPAADWIVFKLRSVSGTRPTRLTMLRMPVAITENVGRRLNIAWNKDTAICLMAANMRAWGNGVNRGKWADLRVFSQDSPGPKLEGAAAALIVHPRPKIRKLLQEAALAFGLPTNTHDGVPVKELPEVKQSYWFLSFGEKDVDKVIDYCKQTGFKQVMMSFGAWCTGSGHYAFKTAYYPDGKESLKRTVDRLHAQGILAGMHTFVSKVKKTDPYVTPIPDKRFWSDMQITLADSVTVKQTTIRASESLTQWPGSPVCKRKSWEGGIGKHQEVVIGNEIVRYKSIGPEGRYDTFMDCERGAWKTRAASHSAGETGRHFGVDGCINGYIIDQETPLIDEVAARLADVFNYCGFDMVYFDGGEDVDRRRFNYYVTRFQQAAMSKFTKRPIVHQGTIMTHRLWHSFARTATVDTYINTLRGHIVARGREPEKWRTVKEHIDRSVKRVISYQQDLIPGELGWFGIWPRDRYSDGLQLDEVEYLMVKSLAYDTPISLQTRFGKMESHPLTPQILQIVKEYEQMRLAGTVSEAALAKLREMGRDFILIQGRRPEFVEVREMPMVAGTHDVRAFVGQRPGGAVATVWHYIKDGKLTLVVDPKRLRAATFMNGPIEVAKAGGKAVLPVNSWRTTLFFDGASANEARRILATGIFEERQPVKLWIQAEAFSKRAGKMAKGSAAGVKEPGAFGDVVVCTGRPDREVGKAWYCEYTADLPRSGRWTIWGRVRYPSKSDHSFGLVPKGEEVTLSGRQVFGNCGVNHGKWHWTGRGGGSTSVPPGAPITLKLPKGPFTFRVYAREGGGSAPSNPRIDCICLCDDPRYVPTDEDAAAATALK